MPSFKKWLATILSGLKGKPRGKAEPNSEDHLSPTKPYEVIRRGQGYLRVNEQTVLLQPGFLVGRGESCQVQLTDPNVSRVHASFIPVDEGWLLQDNASKNGTLVNGRRVQSALLKTGDTIQIGQTVLVYEER